MKMPFLVMIVHLELSAERNETDYKLWSNRASVLIQLRRYTDAIESCQKAISIKSDYDTAMYNMACCYSLLNMGSEAFTSLKKAIGLNSKWRDSAKGDSDFDSIRSTQEFRNLVGI